MKTNIDHTSPIVMRAWACLEPSGAIKPLRIYGRLACPVAAIRAMLNMETI